MNSNYSEAYILEAEGISSPELFELLNELPAARLKPIGIMRQESGYRLEPDQEDRNSLGEEMVLSWRLEIELECLTALQEADINALESGLKCLVMVKPEYAVVEGSSVLLTQGTVPAQALVPTSLKVQEEVKLGGGKVSAIKITGSRSRADKNSLRKEINLVENASVYGMAVYGIGLYG